MKICFLTRNIFDLGGIERVTSILANALSEDNEVHIWCCEKNNLSQDRNLYSLNNNIIIKYFNIIKRKSCKSAIRFINTRTNIFNKKRYNKILSKVYFTEEEQKDFINNINKEDYEVVVSTNQHYSILLGMVKKSIRAKVIGWQHATYSTLLETKKMLMWNQEELFKEYMSYLDEIIVLTDEDKKLYCEKLNLKAKVIENPVSFKTEKKCDINSKNIIYVGRLDFDKQPELALKVFYKIYNKYKDWNLIFVGDGEEMNNLKNEAKELGIQNNVKFIGKVNNVIDYYLKASIFLNTSKWENFSLSLIEAMECGVPIIAFDNQGPREIINGNGKNGILVPNGDLEDLENEIINLIESEEKRKEISRNGIERVKDFYMESIIEKWKKILN